MPLERAAIQREVLGLSSGLFFVGFFENFSRKYS